MKIRNSEPTEFKELNKVLANLITDISKILGDNLAGVYLVGSFALGDADIYSDCDFLVTIHNPLTSEQETGLRVLHNKIPTRSGRWTKHLEGSYLEETDLKSLDNLGKKKWLFIDHGQRKMEWSTHCNSEVHRWTLYETGIPIAGPDPKTFAVKVDSEIMKNKMRHLAQVFLPEFYTWMSFDIAWGQRYAVITLCRILYTIVAGKPTSKKKALLWGIENLDKKWSMLIKQALDERELGFDINDKPDPERVKETIAFAQYAKHLSKRAHKNITPIKSVNDVLNDFAGKANALLGDNIIGIYLFGSLSYNDFNSKRSDIDLSVVVKIPLSQEEGEKIKNLHLELEKRHPFWKERIECSYTPIDLFSSILPPKQPRPYYGAGVFYFEAPYGNEWLINNYLLYHKSITLQGKDFRELVVPIDVRDVQKASIRDLFKEWEPKINDYEWLSNSHYQSYLVLNLCRILYTVLQNSVGSKTVSATWVKNEYPEWKNIIEEAEKWEYGVEMKRQEEVIEFIKFTIQKIKEKDIM
ncbi:MAG TPA: aminoglycoside adenylyltransferase domain-containing protein [Candidatus Saccharimonadales bacterium]|nr:aminoglycoside adenylyltransferase domain-containing protein [Candidatus Saccharimonadales bacterium]